MILSILSMGLLQVCVCLLELYIDPTYILLTYATNYFMIYICMIGRLSGRCIFHSQADALRGTRCIL